MNRSRTLLITLLAVVFIIMQFFRPARNRAKDDLSLDISKVYQIPVPVKNILVNSCYDCHSNNTAYPWYSQVQPMGWWLSSHIKEGKAELNFNEFKSYSPRRQKSKLKAIAASVEDWSMPLPSYLWIHQNARLSDDKRKKVQVWAEHTLDSITNLNQ